MTEQELEILREIQKAVNQSLNKSALALILNSWNNPESNVTDDDMLIMLKKYNSGTEHDD